MKNKNQGITLIALIITIIIMLILVAVSISIAINNGLFKVAGKATKDTRTELDKETELSGGKVNIEGTIYNSIEEYTAEIGEKKEIHNWTRTGDTVTCSSCSTTLTIGQEVNYTSGGTSTTSISEIKSGISQAKLDGKSWASSYGEQILNRDVETKWLVLGIEDKNKDGNNETLLITTKKPITEGVIFYGAAAYNNGPSEIERMCKELYGEEARGMTIEDVNNCLEYTPVGGYVYNNGYIKVADGMTTRLDELGDLWTSIKEKGINTPDGLNTEEALGRYLFDYYDYRADANIPAGIGTPYPTYANGEAGKAIIFGDDYEFSYILGSRGVHIFQDEVSFGLGDVSGGCVFSGGAWGFSSTGEKSMGTSVIRAVVSLAGELPF